MRGLRFNPLSVIEPYARVYFEYLDYTPSLVYVSLARHPYLLYKVAASLCVHVRMRMRICVCVCVCVCLCVCMCICVCACVCVCMRMCQCLRLCQCQCMCMCMCPSDSVCLTLSVCLYPPPPSFRYDRRIATKLATYNYLDRCGNCSNVNNCRMYDPGHWAHGGHFPKREL